MEVHIKGKRGRLLLTSWDPVDTTKTPPQPVSFTAEINVSP